MVPKTCKSWGLCNVPKVLLQWRVKHTWVMGIETKVVIPLFNSGMQGPVVATEAHREEVVLLCRVPEQKCPFRFPFQKGFCFVAVHHSPVTGITCDLEQVRHEAVYVIDLRVDFPGSNLRGHGCLQIPDVASASGDCKHSVVVSSSESQLACGCRTVPITSVIPGANFEVPVYITG